MLIIPVSIVCENGCNALVSVLKALKALKAIPTVPPFDVHPKIEEQDQHEDKERKGKTPKPKKKAAKKKAADKKRKPPTTPVNTAEAMKEVEELFETEPLEYTPVVFTGCRKRFMGELKERFSMPHSEASKCWMLSGVRAQLLGTLSQSELKKRRFL